MKAPMADSSSEDLEAYSDRRSRRGTSKAPWRTLLATGGLLAVVGTVGTLYQSRHGVRTTFESKGITGLAEKEDVKEEEEKRVCEDLPFVRLMDVVSSNLGGAGPDTDKEEGIIYQVKAYRLGLDSADDVQLHLHANSEFSGHDKTEGSDIEPDYKPAWPKKNGISGHFGSINIKPGTNVTCRVHLYNTTSKEDMMVPTIAMTFYDLDTGRDATHSVEYLTIGGFKNYFLTNKSELNVTTNEDDTTTFRATKEGNGDDNPDDPITLTVLQKNRVVSFEFENTDEVKFQVGASPGRTARVFNFVVRPALRCAWTKMEDGNLIASNSAEQPISILKGGAAGVGPAVATFAAVFFLSMFNQ
mmetsp:Transcript_49087/g.110419  ORF Transcript_49087/g.110419 Transcript_49087/m.110419 type:complete len:358 (-) Transcript_49087:191-1264(-)